ncbi:MAG: non-ribosomal peptide synthase [Candidatus Dadabacteria bacterium]|nr:non-ribosomal peptide synthase [Candidatus Dadabacteria bacterium]
MNRIADVDLKTIVSLTGMPRLRNVANPTDPRAMASNVRVAFRPVPPRYGNGRIREFSGELKASLLRIGVTVVPWEEATVQDGAFGILSRVFNIRRVKRDINAVVDVKREPSILRRALSAIAEAVYLYVRKPGRSVMEILKISGWADDFTQKYIQDPFSTQVITIVPLESEFEDENTTYDVKIEIGLSHLIGTMSEIVIGVSEDNFAIINMNLSDSVYSHGQLDGFVLNSLVPKIYAPIKPPILSRFKISEYNPAENENTGALASLGKMVRPTGLFPEGYKFSERISRVSHRDVLSNILDGRTGVSYGFIAIVEPPEYKGERDITEAEWNAFAPVRGMSDVRESSLGRWYIRVNVGGREIFRQIPDLWTVTSRSGCDKTNLDPMTDIVRIGIINGQLHLQIPAGMDLSRRDIRPSFDTFVILAQAFSFALYMPEVVEKDGISILHFHGYPSPEWFRAGEVCEGADNPSLPCGTVEAALLNYAAVYKVADSPPADGDMKILCLVESDHGVNIVGADRGYMVDRLKNGAERGSIMLGGKYLSMLKQQAGRPAA